MRTHRQFCRLLKSLLSSLCSSIWQFRKRYTESYTLTAKKGLLWGLRREISGITLNHRRWTGFPKRKCRQCYAPVTKHRPSEGVARLRKQYPSTAGRCGHISDKWVYTETVVGVGASKDVPVHSVVRANLFSCHKPSLALEKRNAQRPTVHGPSWGLFIRTNTNGPAGNPRRAWTPGWTGVITVFGQTPAGFAGTRRTTVAWLHSTPNHRLKSRYFLQTTKQSFFRLKHTTSCALCEAERARRVNAPKLPHPTPPGTPKGQSAARTPTDWHCSCAPTFI